MPKNSNKYRTGMADRVRAAARQTSRSFSRAEIINNLDLLSRETKAFNTAWLDLLRRGELIDHGRFFRYDPAMAPKSDVRNRMARAMHVKGAFCAGDIAKLSDADPSYVHATIRKLAKAGWLEMTGKKGRVRFFRVRNSEKFYLAFVKAA